MRADSSGGAHMVDDAVIRAVAQAQCRAFRVSVAEMEARLRAGRYPRMIEAHLRLRASSQSHAAEVRRDLLEESWLGRRVVFADDAGEIQIHGPYDTDLGRVVLNANGHWCGAELQGRQCFVVPMTEMESLLAGMRRWREQQARKRQVLADAKKDLHEVLFGRSD